MCGQLANVCVCRSWLCMWPTNYVRKSGLITVANMEGVNSLKNRSVLKECERRTELRALVGTIYVYRIKESLTTIVRRQHYSRHQRSRQQRGTRDSSHHATKHCQNLLTSLPESRAGTAPPHCGMRSASRAAWPTGARGAGGGRRRERAGGHVLVAIRHFRDGAA